MDHYDEIIDKVQGYEFFKTELKLRYRVAKIRYIQKVESRQLCKNLTGYPGVGKTLIVKQYSRAIQRPLVSVAFASQNHPKIIDGIAQSYQGAEIGKVLSCFVEEKASMTFTIDELRTELNAIKRLKNVAMGKETERQHNLMKHLQTQIEDLENRGEDKLTEERYSAGPIFLIDEYEKCGDRPCKQSAGSIGDPEFKYSFTDKFFNFPIDI